MLVVICQRKAKKTMARNPINYVC
jgi:hypothetical protein